MDNKLTKTDYIHYLNCPKSLWLLKNKPDRYNQKALDKFLIKIIKDGYEVERYSKELFKDGVSLPAGNSSVEKTKEALEKKHKILFQPTFSTEDGMFARADTIERNDDGSYNIYEVKSTSAIKKDKAHNHIKDICFQVIALERSGLKIKNANIIHINSDYVRKEEIEPEKLLKITNVTENVLEIKEETEGEIDMALSFIQKDSIDESFCRCYYETKSNHCGAFEYFNGSLKKDSIWYLSNIRKEKISKLINMDVKMIKDIPVDFDLNERNKLHLMSVIEKIPVIDKEEIGKTLNSLTFPLYFIDYETVSSAVPRVINTKPWQHIPFQYSLHILHEDGKLEHKEYLSDEFCEPREFIESMSENIKDKGSVISWHAQFENSRNKELGERCPSYKEFLQDINDRTFDLKDIFKECYVDSAFCGSASIKNVLPVLCPELSYKNLDVQDGTQAMERWIAFTECENDSDEFLEIKKSLLEYCKLDTFAMVEIYRKLIETIK